MARYRVKSFAHFVGHGHVEPIEGGREIHIHVPPQIVAEVGDLHPGDIVDIELGHERRRNLVYALTVVERAAR